MLENCRKSGKKYHDIYSIYFSYLLFKFRMFTLSKLTKEDFSHFSIFCCSAKKNVGYFMKDFTLSFYNMRKSLCKNKNGCLQ